MNGETKVGIFVLVGSVLFGTAVFLLGDYSFQHFYPVYAEFSDVAGLPDKATVKLSGVEIYRDARFLVGSTSVIGSKFLEVDQGTPAAGVLEAGATVRGETFVPLDRAVAGAVASLEGLIKDVRGDGTLGENLNDILKNLKDVTANVNDLVANSQPHAEKAMERLDSITAKLDAMLIKTDQIVDKINSGQGVAGALVSDQKMKENVSSTLTNLREASESAKVALGRVNGFHTYLKWDFKYEPGARDSKHNFGVKIYPRPGRYYYLGAANMINTKDASKGTDYETMNTIDAQLGWDIKAFELYAGILRGSGGSGLRWRPFYNSRWDHLSVILEGSEFARDRVIKDRRFNSPRFDAGVDVALNKYVSMGIRLNDMLETKRVNYTTRVMFEDKDISYLLGLASLGSLKK
jgi:phospholipid/cholesterol/gamma-HCH transport system substrate-binding protein